MPYSNIATLRELERSKRLLDALQRQRREAAYRRNIPELVRLKRQIRNVSDWAEAVAQEIGQR